MASIAESLPVSNVAAAWSRRGWACALRDVVQALLLVPVVRWFCRPLRVTGAASLPGGPALYVANHASHADTASIIAAMPYRIRRRLAPAAAEDYFFASRAKGAAVQVLTGAFPFPRHGSEGITRARRLLAQGWSVLIFPEGTRSRDGSIAEFKCGAAKLATLGYPVVPVAVRGTREVLHAGGVLPNQSPVHIAFGEAQFLDDRPASIETAKHMERTVRTLARDADLPERRATLRERVRALACSRRGVLLAFCWGVAEAIAFPIVPDLAVALLVLAAPRRMPLIAGAAVLGSATGGMLAFGLGSLLGPRFLEHVPLVTQRMTHAASGWLSAEGAAGLAHQAWSGVPFKAFGWQAASHGIDPASFAVHTLAARAPRILLVGAVFSGGGFALNRWLDRVYAVLAVFVLVFFFAGLARVVAAWS